MTNRNDEIAAPSAWVRPPEWLPGGIHPLADHRIGTRDEWAAARDAWLHEYEQVVAERRDLAKRMLALEQSREEWLDPAKRSTRCAFHLSRRPAARWAKAASL